MSPGISPPFGLHPPPSPSACASRRNILSVYKSQTPTQTPTKVAAQKSRLTYIPTGTSAADKTNTTKPNHSRKFNVRSSEPHNAVLNGAATETTTEHD